MKRYLLSFLLLLLIIMVKGQEASVREELIILPAYPFGDPDPVARPGKIYPYFRFDGYSLLPVNQKHRMVILENRWIKVWIAPDMGGKIWGALDKQSGRYFIYFNNVVKFRDIAMRGPWTSGGIEFNFGSIGHAPTTATPVDYTYRQNDDGSVSCFLGAIELTSRTEWEVEVTLPPDKAWFEVNSTWNNPSNQKTSLYHWQTAAADATDDLQYFFPGTAYIDHSGNASQWPVLPDGRDISLYRNNNYGTYHSYHVLGEYADWFAGYYHKTGYGFGHWSRYPEKPGKKIWIWGLSRQGEIWKEILTDSARGNEQYTEIQTGLLFNQEADESTLSPFKHLYMMPGAVENFTERWFPVGKTNGVASVSTEGILNIVKNNEGFKLIFQSLEYVKDSIQVEDSAGKVLYEFPVSLGPEQLFEKDFTYNGKKFIVSLKKGELSFHYGDGNTTILGRPLKMAGDFNWESVYGLYTRGVEKSRQRLYSEARSLFEKCLDKDPDYLPAFTGLAEIDFREMRYSDCETKLFKVLSFDTYDPDANYLYGNICLQKKEYNKARDAFGITLRDPGYRSSSYNQLAMIALKENHTGEAWDYIQKAELANGMDQNIYRTAALIARMRNDSISYDLLMKRLAFLNPLSHFVGFERYLTNSDSLSLEEFLAGFNSELRYESFIELALWYLNAGREGEAFILMQLSPAHPLADYLTAFLAFRLNDRQKSEFYLNRALTADDKLVFPYREEYTGIFKWADLRSNHWKTKYYSALLYWSKGQTERASEYFWLCGDRPDSSSFYLSRGSFLNQTGGSVEDDYLKAVKYGKDQWRPYHILHNYYMSLGQYQKGLSVSTDAMKIFGNSYIIRSDHAQSLLYTAKYTECIKLLNNTTIIPFEGAAYGRAIWRQANLLEAIRLINTGRIADGKAKVAAAKLWPENLGVGRPYVVDELYEDLLDEICNIKSGNKVNEDKIGPLISQLGKNGSSGSNSKDPEKLIIEGIQGLLVSAGLKI